MGLVASPSTTTMAACSVDTLIGDAVTNRFTGNTPDRFQALVLQLLCSINTQLGMASCNVDTLISDAVTNRFTGNLPDRWEALVLQLLCEIESNISSSTGSINFGPIDPVDPPSNPANASLYYNTTTHVLWAWNPDTAQWE